MRFLVPMLFCLAIEVSSAEVTKVKIASVPREFAPWNGSMFTEPLTVISYDFEVNKEKSRARIVVTYTYRAEQSYIDNNGLRPEPSAVQVPGLVYDQAAKTVVYKSNRTSTVCGDVKEQKRLFGTGLTVKSTGSCVVTSSTADRSRDDGWTLHKMPELDVFLEVR